MIRYIYALLISVFLFGMVASASAAPLAEDIVYVVQPGDTLSYIAAKYGVTVEAIARINKIPDVNQIHPGLNLIIPNPEGVTTSNESQSVSISSSGIISSTTDVVFPPLSSIPVITPHMREVYVNSTHRGKKLNMFTAVGDCNLAPSMRIWRFAERGVNLSRHPAIQSAADFFSPSFYRTLLASNPGFTSSSLSNSTWANPAYCKKGESPLVCDLRDSEASIVFINIGTNDLYYWFDFENHYRKIIESALREGSLPVLVTKADDIEETRAGSGYINNVIRRLGKEYDLPVFDFWLATRQLPNNGLVENQPNHYTEEAFDMRLLGFLYTVSAISRP